MTRVNYNTIVLPGERAAFGNKGVRHDLAHVRVL